MNDDIDLTDRLRALAATEPREAGPAVEQKLLAAVRARKSLRLSFWLAAAAASIVIAVLAFGFAFGDRPARSTAQPFEAPGFVALPYAQSGVPLESVVVVRVRMRPAELSSIGVAVPAAAPTTQITADLLVGQDGVARAVRLIQ